MVKITVLGSGVLGLKIAGELAYHGHEVRIYDQQPEALDRVQPRLLEDRKHLRLDGLLAQNTFVGDVFCMSRLEEAVKDAEFIFEAISEDLSAKQDMFERASHCCPRDTIIATNSMRLGLDAIVERAAHRERCLGIRFLFPVYCIPEVEIVTSQFTALSVLQKVQSFLERMGKIAFFRSGKEPLVLTEEQRKSRRDAYVRHMQKSKFLGRKPPVPLPELAASDTLSMALSAEIAGGATPQEKDCVICMDEERNCVLHPCHHLCTCTGCGRMLLKRQDACPICRKHISSIFRIFHA